MACQSEKQAVEDLLFGCMKARFAERNIDLEAYLNVVEEDLIEQNVLDNKSGAAKLAFFKRIATEGVFMDITLTPAMDSISQHLNLNNLDSMLTCLENNSFILLGDSSDYTYFEKAKLLKKEMHKMEQLGFVSSNLTAKAMVKVYTAEDFKHPLYRAQMLILACVTASPNYLKDEANKEKQKVNLNDEVHDKALKIYFDEKLDSIRIGENLYTNFDNKNELIGNYLRSETYTHIIISPMHDTHYDAFIEVMQLLNKQYNDFINEKSLEIYGKAFTNLSDEEAAEIKTNFPLRIIEV